MAYTAIDDPEAYFQVKTYTGDGGTPSITLDGDTDMQPDLVWIKNRDATDAHCLFNSVAGAGELTTSNTGAATATDADTLTSFDSDGFTLGADVKVNTDTEKYVAWCWKESATAGFDIVQFSGNTTNRTVAHSLSAVPYFYTYQQATQDAGKVVYHKHNDASGVPDNLTLNNNNAASDHDAWHLDTHPTSSVFSVGDNADVNADGTNNIRVLLWTPIQGFSKFGTYEGNADADGRFVYTGFRPALVITKSIDSTSSWHMFDNKREGYNVDNDPLVTEDTTAEATTDMIDLLSNGFKCRITTDPNVAETYVYLAFAEAPFVNSNGVPCNAR